MRFHDRTLGSANRPGSRLAGTFRCVHQGKSHIDRICFKSVIGMPFRITQFSPDTWCTEEIPKNGIVHVMVWPSTEVGPSARLPAKLAFLGIHLHFQPIYQWIVERTLLLKRIGGLDINIYSPNLTVTARTPLSSDRI
ncbi:MAG: hypothetical protein AMJ46_14120 [Latescibacteria bacterium DG_63]|nr:MAG: hypothetical protein AMJ46_14120 [Latescibacteria bacterium DG_63]